MTTEYFDRFGFGSWKVDLEQFLMPICNSQARPRGLRYAFVFTGSFLVQLLGTGRASQEGSPQHICHLHGRDSRSLLGQHRSLATTGRGSDTSDDDTPEHQQQPEALEAQLVGTANEAASEEQSAPESPGLDLEILRGDPTGEPLNPGLRASRSWEPFAELDPSEGLEVRPCAVLL